MRMVTRRRGVAVTPTTILLIVAVVCFLLVAFGVTLGEVNLGGLGLAAFAAAFIFR
jgi:hypothetical protein